MHAVALVVLTVAAIAAALLAPQRPAAARSERLPAIVFVSRNPVPGEPGAIPGLGPHHRAVVTGGRLLMREPDGRVRELLPAGAFFDVSDPSVSPSARRIAFAAVTYPDSAWRLWVVGVDGSDLRQITFDRDRGSVRRFDDLDPCWSSENELVFASTRYRQRAQYADLPVTNLFSTGVDGSRFQRPEPMRITTERNGAEEPAMDWTRGRIMFARWWFNRYRATNDSAGITTDPASAVMRDTVNLWQAMEMSRLDPRTHLAAGDLRTRRGSMGYQPAVLADGSIALTYAANLGLSPTAGGTGIQVLTRRFGPARHLAGMIVAGHAGDAYGDAGLLASPSACSPAGLPDGRVLFSYAPGARGDFGLYVADADGSHLERVLDLPGTLELDAAPLVAHTTVPREAPLAGDALEDRDGPQRDAARSGARPYRRPEPAVDSGALTDAPLAEGRTFRFHDLDVFADGPPGSPAHGAVPRTDGARIRFYATLARSQRAGGDTAILIREVPVGPRGEVNERGLPADTPLFEQLADSGGRVLMTAHGPAHVAGLNSGVAGFTTRCVGCHLGHSTLPVRSHAGSHERTRP